MQPDLVFVCYFVLVMNKAVMIVNLLLNINHSIIKTTIPLWNFCITNDHGYVSFVVISLFISSFMTYHRDGNKSNTTSVTLSEHLSSFPILMGFVLLYSFLCSA